MAIRQREYKIPADRRDEAKRLSREASHASVLRQMAQTRFSKAMDAAGSDVEALQFFDDMKAKSLAAEKAQEALLTFLKDLDASIEAEPENWALAPDDETLFYQPPKTGANFPSQRLIRGVN